jgi:pimeloyl-ACP methyl ester carboxylesterase
MPTPALPAPSLARTVRRSGSGSSLGLALAHGAGGSIELNYGPILDGLAIDRTVVGIDYPGTGATPRSTSPLKVDDLADQLVAAADAEGLETFAAAGYSLGGPVAIRAAVRHPDRVAALVLTATFAHRDARLGLAAEIWNSLFEAGDHVLLAKYLTLVALGPAALEATPPDQLRTGIDALASVIAPGTPEHTDLVGRADVRTDLAQVSVPTLVVSTTRDPLVSLALQKQLAAAIPGALLAEIDTGHLPFAERPEEWLKLITGFLGDAEHRS